MRQQKVTRPVGDNKEETTSDDEEIATDPEDDRIAAWVAEVNAAANETCEALVGSEIGAAPAVSQCQPQHGLAHFAVAVLGGQEGMRDELHLDYVVAPFASSLNCLPWSGKDDGRVLKHRRRTKSRPAIARLRQTAVGVAEHRFSICTMVLARVSFESAFPARSFALTFGPRNAWATVSNRQTRSVAKSH